MHCPFCRHADSRVIDSRTSDDGLSIRRRRQCPQCGGRFSTIETASLNVIKQRVESSLKRNLLSNLRNEGKRASNVSWEPRNDDDLRVPGATLNAVLALNLRGTLEHINTTVKINAGE